MSYPGYMLPGGGKVQEVLPPLRKTIAHGRLSVWMRESSNDTIGGMRCRGALEPPGLGRSGRMV